MSSCGVALRAFSSQGKPRQGGVHVIQAFLPAERSEEIQIQGRTARQGKKGSFQMILLIPPIFLADDLGLFWQLVDL